MKFYFITVLSFMVIACSTAEENSVELSRSELPDQQSWNSTIILTREGRKRAVIKSGHLVKYNDRKEIILDNSVDADFFSTEEEHLSNLVSEKALVYEETDNMLAMGNVVVISDSGITLFTDTLLWNQAEEHVITEDSIMLTSESGDTLYGTGFESNVDLTRWKIHRPWGVTGK